jgi:hypothetical protein
MKMKKAIFILVFTISSFSLYGFDSLDLDFSVSYQPLTFTYAFKMFSFSDSDYYDLIYHTPGQFMVYQAGLKHRSGFNFGFGLKYDSGYKKDDNVIGNFSDVLAYLGFKGFQIRVTQLNTPFTIILNPSFITEDQNRIENFTQKRTTVELLYNFRDPDWEIFYVGIYYQSYDGIPNIVDRYGRVYFMNDTLSSSSYGFVLGMDTFSQIYDNNGKFDIGVWVELWLYAGLSPSAGDFGSKIESNVYRVPLLDYRFNSIYGVTFGWGKRTKLVAGIGYNFELDWGLLRHGAIVRGGIRL